MVESRTRQAEVYRKAINLPILAETSDEVTDIYPAVEVGVQIGNYVGWRKVVTPFWVGLRTGLLIDIPKPFYAQRIEGAIRKAGKIAEKLNTTTR